MVNKKSQSALEFLTTYGWAFLVILIMIAALSYFGVLNPTQYLPEKCQTSAGIGCLDQAVSTGDQAVGVDLINNLGRSITVSAIDATITGSSTCTGFENYWVDVPAGNGLWLYSFYPGPIGANPGPLIWEANQRIRVAFECTIPQTFSEGERPTLNFEINYTEAGSSYQRKIYGSVSGNPHDGNVFT